MAGVPSGDADQRFAVVSYSREYNTPEMLKSLIDAGFAVAERPCDASLLRFVDEIDPDVVIFLLRATDPDDQDMARALSEASTALMVAVAPVNEAAGFPALLADGVDLCLADEFGARAIASQVVKLLNRQAEAPRRQPSAPPVLQAGRLVIDTARYEVRLNDARVHLSPMEFGLLVKLAQNKGRVLSPGELLDDTQESPRSAADAGSVVKVYVRRLRERLDELEPGTQFIVNVRGFGYMLNDSGEDSASSSSGATTESRAFS